MRKGCVVCGQMMEEPLSAAARFDASLTRKERVSRFSGFLSKAVGVWTVQRV